MGFAEEFVSVAKISRAQGRRGEVIAELHTDFPERFNERRRLYVLTPEGDRRELELEWHWRHQGRVVLKFRGVDSIAAAQALAGSEIQIRRAERAPLEQGAVYVGDLQGCALLDVGGQAPRHVGTIEDVIFGAGDAPLLLVRHGAKEHLVPFAAEYLRHIDLDGKRVEMLLPEDLLDLDRPLTEDEKRHGK